MIFTSKTCIPDENSANSEVCREKYKKLKILMRQILFKFNFEVNAFLVRFTFMAEISS